ncbi:hypothetical protein CEXT_74481 [Caerostris extrusa]|uniref:Uncharacterized protein n=1 Tax=Caerostris extrusa TaxID=172846 RepID=A0AAV4VDQ1_CAEEX|nr:hypothetical protein CEXT_74481 [Caerostris extrusa]
MSRSTFYFCVGSTASTKRGDNSQKPPPESSSSSIALVCVRTTIAFLWLNRSWDSCTGIHGVRLVIFVIPFRCIFAFSIHS